MYPSTEQYQHQEKETTWKKKRKKGPGRSREGGTKRRALKDSRTSPVQKYEGQFISREPPATSGHTPYTVVVNRWLHGFRPGVDPGYGDSEPCLCARHALHVASIRMKRV